MLADAGASAIAKQYEAGQVSGLMFQIKWAASDRLVMVRLPANVNQVHACMWKEHCKKRSFRSKLKESDFLQQARRTAWKLLVDWVEIQLSLVKLGQVDFTQAFLAYCCDHNGERTIYQHVTERGIACLTGGSEA